MVVEIPVLHANQLSFSIEVWCLEPRHALLIFPRSEPTPADDTLIQMTLLKEKPACLVVEPRMLEETLVAARVERCLRADVGFLRFPLIKDDVVLVCQPSASLAEVKMQMAHHQVDRAYRLRHTHETSTSVLAHLERHRGMMIVMERAEALVAHHPQSQSLGDPLYREVAELLQFEFIHC